MKRSIEYIEKMVCHGEQVDADILHTRTRKEPWLMTRQLIMTLALNQSYTQEVAGRYFCLDHTTALHAKKSIMNRVATDKVFREKYEGYKEMLRDKETFKVAYLSKELARLKKETAELTEQLSKIEI